MLNGRTPLRRQFFWPMAGLAVTASLVTAATAAWLVLRHIEQDRRDRVESIVRTLELGDFPLTPSVLSRLKELTGAEFALIRSTSPAIVTIPGMGDWARTVDVSQWRSGESRTISIAGETYDALRIARRGTNEDSLIFASPARSLRLARWSALGPVVLTAALSSVAALAVAAMLAARFDRRLKRLAERLKQLANRQFAPALDAEPRDELDDVFLTANELTRRLARFEQETEQAARWRLLAQLAGGLAHQLRNSVTGAALSLQLFRRRNPAALDVESLDVAQRQLELTESQLKGLLSLGARSSNECDATPRELDDILRDVDRLAAPLAKHQGIEWRPAEAAIGGSVVVPSGSSLQAALVNLLMNAIDAAGPRGWVSLSAERTGDSIVVSVRDSGPGPHDDLADRIFDPFVTSKPEGVGLGLVQVRHAADELRGDVSWNRTNSVTEFRLRFPVPQASASSPLPNHT